MMDEQTLIKSASRIASPNLTEKCDTYLKALLATCDIADSLGLQEEADKIASKLETIGLLKLSQYEGGNSYWIANSRAFEKAYREKIEKKDYTPHKAWWEVLEEYQKGVLSNQLEFDKYAAADTPLKKIAAKNILQKITDRIEEHGSPGVAICQTLQELESGESFIKAIAEVNSTINKIAECTQNKETLEKALGMGEDLLKEAGFFNWLGQPLNQVLRPFEWGAGQVADVVEDIGYGVKGIGQKVGPHDLTKSVIPIKNKAMDIFNVIKLVRGGTEDQNFLAHYLNPLKNQIESFSTLASMAGIKLPSFQNLASIVSKGLTPENVDQFASLWATIYQAAQNDQLLYRISQSIGAKEKARARERQPKPQEGSPQVRKPLGADFVKSIKDWALKTPIVKTPTGLQPMTPRDANLFESVLMRILRSEGNIRERRAKLYNSNEEIKSLVDRALSFLSKYNIQIDEAALAKEVARYVLQPAATTPEVPRGPEVMNKERQNLSEELGKWTPEGTAEVPRGPEVMNKERQNLSEELGKWSPEATPAAAPLPAAAPSVPAPAAPAAPVTAPAAPVEEPSVPEPVDEPKLRNEYVTQHAKSVLNDPTWHAALAQDLQVLSRQTPRPRYYDVVNKVVQQDQRTVQDIINYIDKVIDVHVMSAEKHGFPKDKLVSGIEERLKDKFSKVYGNSPTYLNFLMALVKANLTARESAGFEQSVA